MLARCIKSFIILGTFLLTSCSDKMNTQNGDNEQPINIVIMNNIKENICEEELLNISEYGAMYVDSIIYGSFSDENANELLAIVRFEYSPCPWNIVECIVMDVNTLETVAVNTYQANDIQIEVVHSNSQADAFFILMNNLSTGIWSQRAYLTKIVDNKFAEEELSFPGVSDDLFWIDTDGAPHNDSASIYLTRDLEGIKLVINSYYRLDENGRIQSVYVWNPDAAIFELQQ